MSNSDMYVRVYIDVKAFCLYKLTSNECVCVCVCGQI